MQNQRIKDGKLAAELALYLLSVVVGEEREYDFQCLCELLIGEPLPEIKVESNMELAKARIMTHPLFCADGTRGTLESIVATDTVFYPGAFNPPHDGHLKGAAAAMRVLEHEMFLTPAKAAEYKSRMLIFSTTINPAHKAALEPAEMLRRVVMMRATKQPVNFLLTVDDPLYLDKVHKFPGANFILGADALDRMMDPKWGVNPVLVLCEIKKADSKLLVLGRLVDGEYMVLRDVHAKHEDAVRVSGAAQWLVSVPFRLDISSSELRAKH